MGFQCGKRLPFFHDRNAVLVRVLIPDTGLGISRRAILDTTFFLKHSGDNEAKLPEKIVSMAGRAVDSGNDCNHLYLFFRFKTASIQEQRIVN